MQHACAGAACDALHMHGTRAALAISVSVSGRESGLSLSLSLSLSESLSESLSLSLSLSVRFDARRRRASVGARAGACHAHHIDPGPPVQPHAMRTDGPSTIYLGTCEP